MAQPQQAFSTQADSSPSDCRLAVQGTQLVSSTSRLTIELVSWFNKPQTTRDFAMRQDSN